MEKYSFDDFIQIIERLRSEDGCPWDKKQTHHSLKQYLLEESYEVIDAINKNDMNNLCEELGDVLLQVALHSQIQKEQAAFDINDVVDSISRKMINRHPHVFSDVVAASSKDVINNWEKIKKDEKGFESQTEAIRNIPTVLPSLLRAAKVLGKVSNTGFELPDFNITIDCLFSDLNELKDDCFDDKAKQVDIIENILLSVVNLSRIVGLNPEITLTNAIEKFINKFEFVEKSN